MSLKIIMLSEEDRFIRLHIIRFNLWHSGKSKNIGTCIRSLAVTTQSHEPFGGDKLFYILTVVVVIPTKKKANKIQRTIYILRWILLCVSYTSINLTPQMQHVHPFLVFHISVMTSSSTPLKLEILIILDFLLSSINQSYQSTSSVNSIF